MLIARFLDGMAGSAFLSVAGGSVGDMFNRDQLQAPMMVFTASPFIGPPGKLSFWSHSSQMHARKELRAMLSRSTSPQETTENHPMIPLSALKG